LSTETNAVVQDQGVIKNMSIPEGWVEGASESFSDTSELRFFHPPDNLDAKLCFFYRGLPIETESGQRFVQVLSAAPHKLTPEEIESLYYTLGESGNNLAFELSAAHTEDFNGKRVLIVQGNWHKSNLHSYDMFIDVDGTGRVIQEVYYLASHAIFDQFFADVKICFSTLIWHDEN
jgi:hypothetical protein